ncbi:hypothetical protein H2O14_02730 [Rhizobium sp. G21]|nr:hypothetical protein [Rhizobium sp. G21]
MMRKELPLRKVSAEHILQVYRDGHRHQIVSDPEAEPDIVLDINSTVADWRDACDLRRWRALGRALNEEWGIAASDSEWKAVLQPSRKRKLLDVCQFIAERAPLPQLEKRGSLGAVCMAAGAFVGICAALRKEGIDTARIRPSTELAPYVRANPHPFVFFAAVVAPGRLPVARFESRFWILSRFMSFGTLKTFGDYARCLTGEITAV